MAYFEEIFWKYTIVITLLVYMVNNIVTKIKYRMTALAIIDINIT